MNNWKLRAVYSGDSTMDWITVNGYLAGTTSDEPLMRVIPFGDKYAAPLRTSGGDTFGPVSNQVPGICNGTFTHTGAGSATVSATSLTGQGSGATFTYTFLADGTLSTIVAASAGTGYLVGDKLRITTSASHGSQVIEFRLVDGSNGTSLGVRLVHDRNNPLPFPVHRAKVNESTPYSFQVLDYRSSQVFPRPQDKLLDKYPDAAAAYGLRLLRSAYLGPAIRVRRESTGWPEIDIHFDAQGNLDTKALLDFAGTSSVRVKTWYDQSGGGNDATQSTNASQPTIVNGGTLVTVNGKPALDFDGSDDHMVATGVTTTQPTTATAVATSANTNGYIFDGDDSLSRQAIIRTITNGWTAFAGQEMRTEYRGLEQLFHYVKFEGTTSDYYIDGTSFLTGVNGGTQVLSGLDIGQRYNDTARLDGTIQEIVLWSADQSANREDIQKDYSDYYQNFQVEDAPLLDAYGGAHAAYSLRKLNSDYTGAAIRVRRNNLDELDIGFDSDGNLDIAAMQAFTGGTLYVATWYDQSGNGNDVTQIATGKQPFILNALGNLMEIDGRPAMRFDGGDAFPFDNTGLDIGNLSTFVTCKFADTSGDEFALRLSGITGDKRWYAPLLQAGNFRFYYGGASVAAETGANTNNNLHTMIAGATQGDMEAFVNGTSIGTATLATGIDATGTAIGGSFAGTNYMNGFIQEVVVYPSDQSERREGIERNISNHYDL